MKKGFTLIELMIVIVMLVILVGVAALIFKTVLLSWSSQETRSGIDLSLDRALEQMSRDLREAEEIQSTAGRDEIRFTQDGATYYIYYLYNSADSYVPPPAFDQATYELRLETLTGGINGTFTYGNGQIIIPDLLPPPTTDLSVAANLITIDASITRGDETIRSRTEIRPRNL